MSDQYVIDTLSDMRVIVSRILGSLTGGREMDEARLFNIRLVLNELITNAFIHGNDRAGGRPVTVAVNRNEDGSLDIAVEDGGEGFETSRASDSPKHAMMDHGRGLLLVRALTREMTFNERGNRVRVRMNM